MIRMILFDLGGVLSEIRIFDSIKKYAGLNMTIDELKSLWLHSRAVRAFEKGSLSKENFAENLIDEMQLRISPRDFLKEFYHWVKKPDPKIFEMLRKLKESYTIGCLSNTNEIHYSLLKNDWSLLDYLDYSFFSFQMHCLKPDEEIFQSILARVPYKAEEILFLDDTAENILAAEKMGFSVLQVHALEQVYSLLEDFL